MNDATPARPDFDVTPRNKVRRMHERGRYDKAAVYPILDAALLAHIAYVIDGQPYCTPTAFWREGDHLYWHGSSASRMLRAQAAGIPVCLAVSHVDGLVLARSGFHHSINYRSVMAFGTAKPLEAEADKHRAMNAFVDRFFPGRADRLRAITAQEAKATTILSMEIEQASAKVRSGPPIDDEEDYGHPVWAGVIPVSTIVGAPVPCPRLAGGAQPGEDMALYAPGAPTDRAFAAAHAKTFGLP